MSQKEEVMMHPRDDWFPMHDNGANADRAVHCWTDVAVVHVQVNLTRKKNRCHQHRLLLLCLLIKQPAIRSKQR